MPPKKCPPKECPPKKGPTKRKRSPSPTTPTKKSMFGKGPAVQLPGPYTVPKSPGPASAPFYAVYFPSEGQGYLFLRSILVGAQSEASLVIGEVDGETYMRKAGKDDGEGKYLPKMEIEFAKKLEDSGVVPKAMFVSEDTNGASSAIFEYCNGKDLESYGKENARDANIEVLIWHVIAEVVKIIAFLHTGYEGVLTGGTEAKKQKEWTPIFHKDYNMGNILLDFPLSYFGDNGMPGVLVPLPKVLLGDFGLAEYKPKGDDGPTINEEFANFADHLEKFLLILTPRRAGEFSKALVNCVKSFKDKNSENASLKSMLSKVLPLAQRHIAKAKDDFVRPSVPHILEPFDKPVTTSTMPGFTRISQLVQGYEWVKVVSKKDGVFGRDRYEIIEHLGRLELDAKVDVISDDEFCPCSDSDGPDQEFLDDGSGNPDQEFTDDED